jgi:hypothetical protein
VLEYLQASWLAHAVGESQMLTATLSSLHLLGFTTIMGSALVSNLRMLGVLFAEQPATDITRPTARALAAGLVLSAVTGALLFMPRAGGAMANPIFRVKLALIVAATVVHFGAQRRFAVGADRSRGAARVVGGAGLVLWFGVALAACAFILIE